MAICFLIISCTPQTPIAKDSTQKSEIKPEKNDDGEWDLDFAVSEIKKNSRRYAKRQTTWNRKLENVNWVNYDNSLQEALSLLSKLRDSEIL